MVSTTTKITFFIVLAICIALAFSQPTTNKPPKINPEALEAAFKIPEAIFKSIVDLSKVLKTQQDAQQG